MTRHAWGRARSLAERPADGVADEGGWERRTRWQQTIPDPELLDERLGHAGHDLESLAAALSDTSAVEGEPPDWWAVLRIAYPDHGTSPIAVGDDEERGLSLVWGGLMLAAPIARLVGRRLRVHARERADAAKLLTERLALELAELAAPALAFDLLATRAAEGWPEDESRQRSLAWMAELGRSARASSSRTFPSWPGASSTAPRSRRTPAASCWTISSRTPRSSAICSMTPRSTQSPACTPPVTPMTGAAA